jgi:hypothetical protein
MPPLTWVNSLGVALSIDPMGVFGLSHIANHEARTSNSSRSLRSVRRQLIFDLVINSAHMSV